MVETAEMAETLMKEQVVLEETVVTESTEPAISFWTEIRNLTVALVEMVDHPQKDRVDNQVPEEMEQVMEKFQELVMMEKKDKVDKILLTIHQNHK